MSSLILVAVLLGMLAAHGVAWGCLLRFGLHWAKVPGASVSRLMGMTVLALLVQTLFGVVYVLVTRLNGPCEW